MDARRDDAEREHGPLPALAQKWVGCGSVGPHQMIGGPEIYPADTSSNPLLLPNRMARAAVIVVLAVALM